MIRDSKRERRKAEATDGDGTLGDRARDGAGAVVDGERARRGFGVGEVSGCITFDPARSKWSVWWTLNERQANQSNDQIHTDRWSQYQGGR